MYSNLEYEKSRDDEIKMCHRLFYLKSQQREDNKWTRNAKAEFVSYFEETEI